LKNSIRNVVLLDEKANHYEAKLELANHWFLEVFKIKK